MNVAAYFRFIIHKDNSNHCRLTTFIHISVIHFVCSGQGSLEFGSSSIFVFDAGVSQFPKKSPASIRNVRLRIAVRRLELKYDENIF